MYVKRAFRSFGVAREMMACMHIDLRKCTVSHWTDDLGEIARRKSYPDLVFNPYLLAG
jgi:hypothetical protein